MLYLASALLLNVLFAYPFTYKLGAPTFIPKPDKKISMYVPDCSMAVVVERDMKETYFWSDGVNKTFRTSSSHITNPGRIDPSWSVLNSSGIIDHHDSWGNWLVAAFRVNGSDTDLFGYSHNEDHHFDGSNVTKGPDHREWYSMTYVTSKDDGRSWQKHGLVVDDPKPYNIPDWSGGAQFFTVVRDYSGKYAFFGYNNRCIAFATKDPLGRDGTWLRWFNGSFSFPGTSSDNDMIKIYNFAKGKDGRYLKCLPGLSHGAYGPAFTHYNTYLKLYIMAYSRFTADAHWKKFWMKWSNDGIHWEEGEMPLIMNATLPDKEKYTFIMPTILTEKNGEAGEDAYLFYGRDPRQDGIKWGKDFFVRKMEFFKN